jgi:predicted dehydrogenase
MFAEGSYFQEQLSAVNDRSKVEAFIPSPSRIRGDGSEREAEFVISPRDSTAPERCVVPVDPEALAAGDHHGLTYYQYMAFNRFVREGGAPEVSVEDGALVFEMGLAAERSIATGHPVEL